MINNYNGCGYCGRFRGVLTRKHNAQKGFNVNCKDCGNSWEAPESAEGVYKAQQIYTAVSDDISTEEYDEAIHRTGKKPYKA